MKIVDLDNKEIDINKELEKDLVKKPLVDFTNDIANFNKIETQPDPPRYENGGKKLDIENIKEPDKKIETHIEIKPNIEKEKIIETITPENHEEDIKIDNENSIYTESSEQGLESSEQGTTEPIIMKNNHTIDIKPEEIMVKDEKEDKGILEESSDDLDEEFGIEIEIKYDDNKWSPKNPNNPKVYSSHFLEQFKQYCTKKPNNFEVEMIPQEGRQTTPHTPPTNNSPRNSRGGQRGRGKRGGRNSYYKPELPPRSDNAWQRPTLGETDKVQKKRMEIIRLLNKISFENYKDEDYIKKIVRCCYSNLEYTELLVDSLYIKAITEPRFSVVYASLTNELMNVKPSYKLTKETTFRRLIVKRCQFEFDNKKRPPPIPEDLSPQKKT